MKCFNCDENVIDSESSETGVVELPRHEILSNVGILIIHSLTNSWTQRLEESLSPHRAINHQQAHTHDYGSTYYFCPHDCNKEWQYNTTTYMWPRSTTPWFDSLLSMLMRLMCQRWNSSLNWICFNGSECCHWVVKKWIWIVRLSFQIKQCVN